MPLRVGVYGTAPFVIPLPNGGWRGAGVELWREVAGAANRRFEMAAYPSYEAMIEALAADRIDVALGDLEIRAGPEKKIDFLLPYHQSHIGIATRTRAHSSLGAVLSRLLSQTVLIIALLVVLAIAAITFVIWRLEKRENAEIFGHKGRDFVSGAVWTALISTGIEGDLFKMRTRSARVLGLVLVLIGVTVVASYIALVSSAMTVDSLSPQVRNAAGLQSVTIGVETDQVGHDYAERTKIRHQLYPTLKAAVDALHGGAVAAVIADRGKLRYHMDRHGDTGLTILPDTLLSDQIAFAVGQGSPLREPLNRALLDILENGTWHEIRRLYGIN